MSKITACLQFKAGFWQKGVFLFLFLLIPNLQIIAQVPKVPAVIEFAGMKLKISEQARKDIQSDVDALYRSEKYFKIKVDRVDLYFPIIERILEEEGVPGDFKYLVIQESSLISDAVSTSNAVGFWQFKQDAGEEVGLKINSYVDERMNIVSSTRGASAYLKKHNSYFDNWVYSLLAYYLGRGGAKSVAEPKLYGADKMEIDKNTNWYILKFLAHKIAFENALGKNANPELRLAEYNQGSQKTLKEISRETNIDIELLEHYNKWLKRGSVPSDKQYTVILPVVTEKQQELIAENEVQAPKETAKLPAEKNSYQSIEIYPKVEGDISNKNEPLLVTINGRPGIISREGDALSAMAAYGGLKEEKFKKINDIRAGHKVKEGQYYYFKPKKNNAPVHYHTVQNEESLWDISQMYGIKQNRILRKNRMSSKEAIRPGMVLWLRFVRPANEPVVYQTVSTSGARNSKKLAEVTTQNKHENKEQPSDFSKKESLKAAEKTKAAPEEKEEEDKDKNTVPDSEKGRNGVDEIKKEQKAPIDGQVIEVPAETETNGQEKISQEVSLNENDPDPYDGNKVNFIEAEKDEEKKDTHIVQEGETLYGISKKYGIPIQDLASWNSIKYDESIKIGQLILINSPTKVTNENASDVRKTPEKVQEKFIIHTVTAGETLYKIAREHNVTIKEVMEWNGKTDFSVALGEVIKIKKIIGND